MTLENAIDADYSYKPGDNGNHFVRIATSSHYSIETGARLDPLREFS